MNVNGINRVSAHPATWVVLAIVLLGIVAWFANDHLKRQERNDLQMTALIDLLYQPGGVLMPHDLAAGVDLIAQTPKPIFDKLFDSPEGVCKMIKCEEAFGSTMTAQSIVTVATSVRNVQLRAAAANNAFWANLMAAASLIISLLTLVITGLFPTFLPKRPGS